MGGYWARRVYWPQQFLYFFPLPHGHGSLRPTFFSAIAGLRGFNSLVKSAISSGLSGSKSILYFHPFSANNAVTSLSRFFVGTVTTAGFFSVPNFAVFLPSKTAVRFSEFTRFLILPISSIRLLICRLFQISADLSIKRA